MLLRGCRLSVDEATSMNVLKRPDQDLLLKSLTDYYEKYRDFMREGGNQADYLSCSDMLNEILAELNSRQKPGQNLSQDGVAEGRTPA